jgi:MFS transporter, ACS family, tartrate transporter
MQTYETEPLSPSLRSKLVRRIALVALLLFVASYIDRANISLLAVPMNRDLGFTAAQYGFGASIFFLGYAFFEIPSNAMLYRFGPRLWLGRIILTWGIFAALMAIIQGTRGFYTLRFLIGLAEAGFQPGVIFYLSRWFPVRERAGAISTFSMAGPLALGLGAPITAMLVTATDGLMGYPGWRWTFFLEGLPSIILGLWTIFYLPDRPATARWLTEDERSSLMRALASEPEAPGHETGWFNWLRDGRIMTLALVYFLILSSNYGVMYWLPQIIAGFGHLSSTEIGVLTAIPFFAALICMRPIARYSDRTGNRRGVTAACLAASALGLLASAYIPSPTVSLIGLAVTTAGTWCSFSPFWAATSGMMRGASRATGLAFVNSVGQFGGLLAPYAVGLILQNTGSYQLSLAAMAVTAAVAGVIVLFVPMSEARQFGDIGTVRAGPS